ncbi:MAG: hypothetical protein IJ681_05315, partial [Bacteroidales bacterium]|nr:hypothetical protein [Bacteroidales bacterium]
MKKIALIGVCIILSVSCTKQLYKYKSYDEAAYKYATAVDAKDVKKAVKAYKDIVETDKKK